MNDPQEARYRAFYGRMESDDILKLLKNGTVSSPTAALAVLAQRGVSAETVPRREKKREDDGGEVDGEDGGLIQMALDFLGNLDFDD